MSTRIVPLLALLGAPAFADGAPGIFAVGLLGLAVALAPVISGLKRSRSLATPFRRWFAGLVTVPAAVAGFTLGFDLAGGFRDEIGGLASFLGPLFGYMPSYLLQLAPKAKRFPNCSPQDPI